MYLVSFFCYETEQGGMVDEGRESEKIEVRVERESTREGGRKSEKTKAEREREST